MILGDRGGRGYAVLGMLMGVLMMSTAGTALAQTLFDRLAPQATPATVLEARRAFQGDDLVGKDGPMRRVGFELALLFEEHQAFAATNAPGPFAPTSRLPRVREERVLIDAVAAGDATALRAALERLGLRRASVYRHMVSGWLPISALADAAALTELRFARPSAMTSSGAEGKSVAREAAARAARVGATTSQGDAAQKSDIARTAFSVDGTGITVGTLSDSYDCLGGAAGDVGTGDLPAGVTVLKDEPGCGSGTDEGRAMMQLIHDVAPGAAQAFYTAFDGTADFAAGIGDLAGLAGADVIVDDVIYLAEPMFQDGIIAQAVDGVEAAGVSYFSSAGNAARHAYEDSYRSGTDPLFLGSAHDFDPGAGTDFYQNITIPTGTGVTVVFQWDQPYASATGGAGSASDVDIFILDDPVSGAIVGGIDGNVGGDPVEVVSFFNDGSFGTDLFNIYFNLFSGPVPTYAKYVIYSFEGSINEFDTASGTSYGHANAAGAESVGAAAYYDTPPFGVSPPVVESFSSAGPTPIFYDLSDSPVSIFRDKPEITAPDGGNTTFFGTDIELDADGFPNFFGTSAAAPHAAGVAALMLEAAGGPGTLLPIDVFSVLEGTAIDMDDPATGGFDVGFDFGTGFGLIDAEAAVGAVAPAAPEITVTSPNGGETWTMGTTMTITWTDNISEDVRIWLRKGGAWIYTISAATASDGSFDWTIPTTFTPASDYDVRVLSVSTFDGADASDANFTLASSTPSITVTSPNGGETWTMGSTMEITWTDNISENVRIWLRKGGTYYRTISASTPSDGSFDWTIPTTYPAASDYDVRVMSVNDFVGADASDTNFTLAAPAAITVTSPNGGETWTMGSTMEITWTDTIPENVRIWLRKGGSYFRTISASTASDGSFNWTIPTNLTAASDYDVRVMSVNTFAGADASDANFTLAAAPSITVTSPNGGETWTMGSTMEITWTDNISENVRIWLRKGGTYYRTISASTPSDGSFDWTIPTTYPAASDYDVRVMSVNDFVGADASDANFTLAAASAAERAAKAGETETLPEAFALTQNYPNPFNPHTLVGFDLPEARHVRLRVYNVLGQHVETLVDGARAAGRHEVRFDATALPAGVYLYVIEAGDFTATRRMTLLK